jgi:hypothetical protein
MSGRIGIGKRARGGGHGGVLLWEKKERGRWLAEGGELIKTFPASGLFPVVLDN